jgi:hypothetical protein
MLEFQESLVIRTRLRSCVRIPGHARRVRYGLLAQPGSTISLKKVISVILTYDR